MQFLAVYHCTAWAQTEDYRNVVAGWWCCLWQIINETWILTVLHAVQTRSNDVKAVCPSVNRMNCDKTEERSVQIFIPYERSFSLVFWEEDGRWGATPYT